MKSREKRRATFTSPCFPPLFLLEVIASLVGLTGQNANQCNAGFSGDYDVEAAPKARIRTVKQHQVRLTEAQIMELVEARVSGLTINRLAERFGIHRTTVMRHLKRNSS